LSIPLCENRGMKDMIGVLEYRNKGNELRDAGRTARTIWLRLLSCRLRGGWREVGGMGGAETRLCSRCRAYVR